MNELKNIKCVCRVCLTQSKNMIVLNTNLRDVGKDLLIVEALEEIVGRKINWGNEFPNLICPMCLGLLKIAYSLKTQFRNSEILLLQHFQSTLEPSLLHSTNPDTEINLKGLSEEPCPVQIIVGSTKYDLNDILIVEEQKPDQSYFKGFLDNLGKSVTAKFVKKSKCSSSLQEEKPIVLIEKLTWSNEKVRSQRKQKSKKQVHSYIECLDQYIITEDSLFTHHSGNTLEKKFDLEKMGLQNLSLADRELFQSALNMQLRCSICNKLYSSRGRFRRHLELCQKLTCDVEDETSNTMPIILKCHICSRIFKEKKFLSYHIKTVHNPGNFKFKCGICEQLVPNRNALMYHKLTKHGERKFICGICNKKFFTSNCLKVHTLRHSQKNIAQCVCPVCGKTFHYKGGLFYHMKMHTNERKYCCEYCDKKFYILNAKKRHTLTHTGIRPYACKYCEKCFFSTSEVRKHEYLHTGVRPYSCQYCKKGFTSSYNMKVHLVSHPGPYPCKLCHKTFVSMSVLLYHNKTKHLVTEEIENLVYSDIQPN